MNGWSLIYPGIGVLIVSGFATFDGVRGAISAMAAWLVGLVPVVVTRVAGIKRVSITSSRTQRLGFLMATFPRVFLTLGVAAIVYRYAEQKLSAGYWFAVLVCYQFSLLAVARQAVRSV
jgi:hypothetical protein